MADQYGDNRFKIIERARQDLVNSTNITSSEEEMKVLDTFLFRCWQMGWLEKYNIEFIKGKEIGKKFMDSIIYDNDFVNRWTPFNEEIHYGNWTNEFGRALIYPIMELGEEFFTDEVINLIACGDAHEMEELIENNPCLRWLDSLLNQYLNYLEKLEFNKIKDNL